MSEVSRVPDPAGVNVCRSAPAPGICDQHGVDFGECADEHPPEVSRVQEPERAETEPCPEGFHYIDRRKARRTHTCALPSPHNGPCQPHPGGPS